MSKIVNFRKPRNLANPLRFSEEKYIFYVSDSSSGGEDLSGILLQSVFDCTIRSFSLTLKKEWEPNKYGNPTCILVSVPLEHTKRSDVQLEELFNDLQELFPECPVIWLIPDEKNIPKFLPKQHATLQFFITDRLHIKISDFYSLIEETTGHKLRVMKSI